MNGMQKFFLVGIVIIALFLADDLRRAGVFGSVGSTNNGSKFGIVVGSPILAAEARLVKIGFKRSETSLPGSCHMVNYSELGQTVTSWVNYSWQKGTICLGASNGKVASINWRIGPLEF